MPTAANTLDTSGFTPTESKIFVGLKVDPMGLHCLEGARRGPLASMLDAVGIKWSARDWRMFDADCLSE